MMLKRDNRSNMAVAKGNAKTAPVTKLTEATLAALEFAHDFFVQENIKWGCVDVIYDKARERHFALEASVGWTMHSYHESAFFNWEASAGAWMPTGKTGADVWNVLVDEIEQGNFK